MTTLMVFAQIMTDMKINEMKTKLEKEKKEFRQELKKIWRETCRKTFQLTKQFLRGYY